MKRAVVYSTYRYLNMSIADMGINSKPIQLNINTASFLLSILCAMFVYRKEISEVEIVWKAKLKS
jgi:hypothetical protein